MPRRHESCDYFFGSSGTALINTRSKSRLSPVRTAGSRAMIGFVSVRSTDGGASQRGLLLLSIRTHLKTQL